jgi:hypothetical protein
MARDPDKPHLPFFLGRFEWLRGAILPDEQVGIVIEADAVHLPKIKMIGSVPLQRIFKHTQCKRLVASMRTDFGHQQHTIAQAL